MVFVLPFKASPNDCPHAKSPYARESPLIRQVTSFSLSRASVSVLKCVLFPPNPAAPQFGYPVKGLGGPPNACGAEPTPPFKRILFIGVERNFRLVPFFVACKRLWGFFSLPSSSTLIDGCDLTRVLRSNERSCCDRKRGDRSG